MRNGVKELEVEGAATIMMIDRRGTDYDDNCDHVPPPLSGRRPNSFPLGHPGRGEKDAAAVVQTERVMASAFFD